MAATTYMPSLDGVRAVAVAAVIAYHLGYLSGGWIGVDLFFLLSGYLITSILLERGDGQRLRGFWGRRAKRLLPAVLGLLVVLSVYSWVQGPGVVPAQLRIPALATLVYGANWQEIAAGHRYFAQFASPSPLAHVWSLAIEEQYYVVWPLVLGALVWATTRFGGTKRRGGAPGRRALILATLGLALASATWMGVAAHLSGPNRAYLGTDTRAWELLLGGALAMRFPAGQAARRPAGWAAAATVGIAGVVFGVLKAGGPPGWIWDGGLMAIALGGGLLIVGSVKAPSSTVSRVLSLRPLRWVGRISYGLYLWHWPVIVLVTSQSSGLSGPGLLGARLAVTLSAAALSFYLIERPLRRLDWSELGRRFRPWLGRLRPAGLVTAAGILTTAAVIIGGTSGPALASSAPLTLASLPPAPALPLLDLPPASPGHPYRVWIVGDSVMADAAPGITAALQSTGEVKVVANSATGGWGLINDGGFPGNAAQAVAEAHPQIVIGTWSWDDDAAMADRGAYLRRLEGTMRRLLAPGTGIKAVILLQFPQLGPETEIVNGPEITAGWRYAVQSQNVWDGVAVTATDAFPGHAAYVPTNQLFAPGGRFFTWMRTSSGDWLRARKLDNLHFCPYGAAEFGALLARDLTPRLHLPPMKPGWETASWTHDANYNEPPGACPNDQPPPFYRGVSIPASSGR